MNIDEKKIYFIISPHINYYHSYRGDSRGTNGFGKDLKIMRGILDKLDEIEEIGYSFRDMKVTWDYADTFWSIQLQKEYQQDVLDRVIERCKKGKDEVLIGSWANAAQSILDTEEFIQDYKWFLENDMGIGMKQLFPGRIAPYARTQEVMFTSGMIELYNQLGVEGFCLYYSVYSFDVGRAFLNPRLSENQRYGLVKFNSSISDASMLMIPMYDFGDIIDFFSIKRWFKLIRKMQEQGKISGHALLFFNFDMDSEEWIGYKLPKFLRWMPKTGGLNELAKAVDELEYVEFANMLDIIPKLEIHGETTLYPDAADGTWNGFYNWAQKYDNTKFWTIGQRARWFKCITDTIVTKDLNQSKKAEINKLLRNSNSTSESYIKNKLLFASTTNFGLSVPYQHPNRQRTAISYGLKAQKAAEKAFQLTINEFYAKKFSEIKTDNNFMTVVPIVNRGITDQEKSGIKTPLFIKTELPHDISMDIITQNKKLDLKNIKCGIYQNQSNENLFLECFIPENLFIDNNIFTSDLILRDSDNDKGKIEANPLLLKNEVVTLKLNHNGDIISFIYKERELVCPKFLESAVTFGKPKEGKRYAPKQSKVDILRDGSDGFSASIKIISDFEIVPNSIVHVEKIVTLYSENPILFVNVVMNVCDIKGLYTAEDGTSFVQEGYDMRWQEIIPCEIKPNLIGDEETLKIWKKNFFGKVSYFNLDMREVDSRNSNIDCLVSNISDGWMAISDKNWGLLVGFNSLKAANFAFSPLKIRDKGFGDGYTKGQQVRINPFGNYYGNLLHYWTEGSGHAAKITPVFQVHQISSTAPTYSGKTLEFDLIIAPYEGDMPPKAIQSFADHYSIPPLVIIGKKNDSKIIENYSIFSKMAESLKEEYKVENVMDMSYMEWVKDINKEFDPNKPEKVKGEGLVSKLGLYKLILQLIDGIRGR